MTDAELKDLIQYIQENRETLYDLNLKNLGIGPKEIDAILKALKGSTTLTHLDLSWNHNLRSEGSKIIAQFLENNTSLIELNLEQNDILDRGTLENGNSDLEEEEDTSFVELNSERDRLIAEGNLEGVNCIALALKKNKTLRILHIGDNNLTPQAVQVIVEAFEENITLTCLTFADTHDGNCHTKLGSEGALAIAGLLKKNTPLTSLTLKNNDVTTKELRVMIEALGENTTLTSLSLGNAELDEGPSFNGLKAIFMIAEMLRQNKTLKDLRLSIMEDVMGENIQVLIEALKENRTLEFLDLSELDLTLSAMKAFTAALAKNKIFITGLRISIVQLREYLQMIVEALEKNKKLIALELSGNPLDSVEAIALLIEKCNSLKSLDLEGTLNSVGTENFKKPRSLSDEQVKRIIKAVEKNRTLENLRLPRLPFEQAVRIEKARALARLPGGETVHAPVPSLLYLVSKYLVTTLNYISLDKMTKDLVTPIKRGREVLWQLDTKKQKREEGAKEIILQMSKCIEEGNYDTFSDLMKKHQEWMDINQKNKEGKTLLHMASNIPDPRFLEALLTSRSDPNVADEAGWTPVHYAAYKGHLDLIRVFMYKEDKIAVEWRKTTHDGKDILALIALGEGIFKKKKEEYSQLKLLIEGIRAMMQMNDNVNRMLGRR